MNRLLPDLEAEENFTKKISLGRKQISIVPEIRMSPIHPLKDGISAISAASSRQLLFQVDCRKTKHLSETNIK